MSKKERFNEIYHDGHSMKYEGRRTIIVDEETGVHYLVWHSGYAGGITPLLDSEGKVVIRKTGGEAKYLPDRSGASLNSLEIKVGDGGEITVKGENKK